MTFAFNLVSFVIAEVQKCPKREVQSVTLGLQLLVISYHSYKFNRIEKINLITVIYYPKGLLWLSLLLSLFQVRQAVLT